MLDYVSFSGSCLIPIFASLGFHLDIYDFADDWLLVCSIWIVISLLMAR